MISLRLPHSGEWKFYFQFNSSPRKKFSVCELNTAVIGNKGPEVRTEQHCSIGNSIQD